MGNTEESKGNATWALTGTSSDKSALGVRLTPPVNDKHRIIRRRKPNFKRGLTTFRPAHLK